MSNVALPGMNNFVGEVMILFGVFLERPYLASVLGLTVILSVIYMLRWMRKMYFDKPVFHQEKWVDIRVKEFAIAMPLLFLIF